MRNSASLEFQAPTAEPSAAVVLPLNAFNPKRTTALYFKIKI
jgi:hypothetical protein